MTLIGWEIVGTNNQELQIAKTVGDALRDLIRKRYRNNAAKRIERDWDLDPRTARNVVTQGNVSERTLTKAIRAEGWGLIQALGEELTGESFFAHEERRLQSQIREATDAHQNLVNLRHAREALERRAADLDGLDVRQVAVEGRRGGGRPWSPDDELGDRQADRQASKQGEGS